MRNQTEPALSKWPFYLGDLLLVGVAGLIYSKSNLPFGLGEAGLITVCVAAGAVLAILPFVLEYRVAARLAESASLTEVVAQIQQVETVAQQISGATARWQSVQEVAERVASTSKAIAERMSTRSSGIYRVYAAGKRVREGNSATGNREVAARGSRVGPGRGPNAGPRVRAAPGGSALGSTETDRAIGSFPTCLPGCGPADWFDTIYG